MLFAYFDCFLPIGSCVNGIGSLLRIKLEIQEYREIHVNSRESSKRGNKRKIARIEGNRGKSGIAREIGNCEGCARNRGTEEITEGKFARTFMRMRLTIVDKMFRFIPESSTIYENAN